MKRGGHEAPDQPRARLRSPYLTVLSRRKAPGPDMASWGLCENGVAVTASQDARGSLPR